MNITLKTMLFIAPFVAASRSVRIDDKKSLKLAMDEYENLFRYTKLKNVSTGKGYYSKKNVKHALRKGVKKVGIQVLVSAVDDSAQLSIKDQEVLYNSRSGIEPLIGHAKQGDQLGRSRMKKDEPLKRLDMHRYWGLT